MRPMVDPAVKDIVRLADPADAALLWPRRSAAPIPDIHRYWVARHVAATPEGASCMTDALAAGLVAERKGERPLGIVSWRAGSLAVEVALAQRLLACDFPSFHVDCIEPDEDAAARGLRRIRDAGLEGYLSVLRLDPNLGRAPGTYDVHLAIGALSSAGSPETLLAAVDQTMTDGSVLVVSDAVGPAVDLPCPESGPILTQLWPALRRDERYDHTRGRFVDDARELFQDPQHADARSFDLFSLLETRFQFEELRGFGGLIDVFVGPSLGPNFSALLDRDRRFVDLVCRLEAELRAARAIRPALAIGKLRRKGCWPVTVSSASLRTVVPLPSAPAFALQPVERAPRRCVLSHEMNGDSDAAFLGDGFYYWETENRLRWTSTEFELRIDPAPGDTPGVRTAVLTFLPPARDPGGALDVFADGAPASHVGSVYRYLAATDGRLEVTYVTHGGPTRLTFRLERPQPAADDRDHRALGLVIRRLEVWTP